MTIELVTLDWHGFTRKVPKPKNLYAPLSVPLHLRLGSGGCDPFSSLEGNEESLLVFCVSFKWLGQRYGCAGCVVCRPGELERRLRLVAVTTAETVIREMWAPNGLLRRQWNRELRELAKMRAAIRGSKLSKKGARRR